MMQGDEFYLGVRLLNNAGSDITPSDVQDVEFWFETLSWTWKKQQLYYEDGIWYLPITQEMTLSCWPAQVKAQVRVRWNNGVVEGCRIAGVRMDPGYSREVL